MSADHTLYRLVLLCGIASAWAGGFLLAHYSNPLDLILLAGCVGLNVVAACSPLPDTEHDGGEQ